MRILVSAILVLIASQAMANTLTCVSNNNAFTRCNLSSADQRDIRIKNVQSGNCDANGAWGVDSTSIWVNKGCGATFEYSDAASASDDYTGANVIVAPGFTGPYYGPGFYYGAGFYDYNGWNENDYCNNNHNCNRNQQHENDYNHDNVDHDEFHGDNEFHGGSFHGGGGGFHGGGGRR